jgi:type IV pilus assembly protein PilC
MIAAGLPIIKSLTILARQTKNTYFKDVIADLIIRLEEGGSFKSALSAHADVFNEVYIASVAAAEASGKFEQVLSELSEQQESEYKLESSVKSAVAYPIFIVFAMIGASIILLVMVIPKLQTIFEDSNMALPWTTKALIATASFVTNYWYIITVCLIALVLWIRYYLKTESGKYVYGRMVVSIPVVKDFFVSVYMSRFSKTFSMLMKAGVPIIDAIKIVSKVINNKVYEKILIDSTGQLERGVPLSVPIGNAPEFPLIVSQMIAVGEQTGRIDEIILSLSIFFDDETEKKVKSLTSLLEPIMLLIVGVGVGIIVFAIIVPIYQISGNLG